MSRLLLSCLSILIMTACATLSPQQQFSNGCATAAEAMVNVIAARRAGKIDDVTYNNIDNMYDAAVKTCENPPITDDGYSIAASKLIEFASYASNVAGVKDYGSY